MKKIMRKKRAFSLVELLIAITILAIVGGVAVSALNLMFASFWQTDTQIAARSEIEFALNELRPQFTNIGLGMPNSKVPGSFKKGFDGIGGLAASMNAPVQPMPANGGAELLYAWAIPTDVLVMSRHEVSPDINLPYRVKEEKLSFDVPVSYLDKYKFVIAGKSNPNSWVLFPSLRIPLHAEDKNGDKLTVAANSGRGSLQSYSEIHLLRVARLRVDDKKQLMQEIQNVETKVLATNIEFVSFDFNPGTRLLKMTITAGGNSEKHKIKESVTWRIRN